MSIGHFKVASNNQILELELANNFIFEYVFDKKGNKTRLSVKHTEILNKNVNYALI